MDIIFVVAADVGVVGYRVFGIVKYGVDARIFVDMKAA